MANKRQAVVSFVDNEWLIDYCIYVVTAGAVFARLSVEMQPWDASRKSYDSVNWNFYEIIDFKLIYLPWSDWFSLL